MKSIALSTIALCLAISSCFAPPRQSALELAPQTISALELSRMNIEALMGDHGVCISADYVFSMTANAVIAGRDMMDIHERMSASIKTSTDGFEMTLRSADMLMDGIPGFDIDLPDIPEFEMRVTASNASGMYARGSFSLPELDKDEQLPVLPVLLTEHAFLNADIYSSIKGMWASMLSQIPLIDFFDVQMLGGTDEELLQALLSKAMMEELSLKLDRVEGNHYFYTTDVAKQMVAVVKNILSQVDRDELLGLFYDSDAVIPDYARLCLALSDEQLELILPAIFAVFDTSSEYEIIRADNGTLIPVGYNGTLSTPPAPELTTRVAHLFSLIPDNFGWSDGYTEEDLLAPFSSWRGFSDTSLSINATSSYQNIDLSDIDPGHFDFKKPEKATDYSEVVGPQLLMLSQMLQTELGISGNEDAEASKVF